MGTGRGMGRGDGDGMELTVLGLTELDPELGTAQPLLVFNFFKKHNLLMRLSYNHCCTSCLLFNSFLDIISLSMLI